jgi:hypothetical protein
MNLIVFLIIPTGNTQIFLQSKNSVTLQKVEWINPKKITVDKKMNYRMQVAPISEEV